MGNQTFVVYFLGRSVESKVSYLQNSTTPIKVWNSLYFEILEGSKPNSCYKAKQSGALSRKCSGSDNKY